MATPPNYRTVPADPPDDAGANVGAARPRIFDPGEVEHGKVLARLLKDRAVSGKAIESLPDDLFRLADYLANTRDVEQRPRRLRAYLHGQTPEFARRVEDLIEQAAPLIDDEPEREPEGRPAFDLGVVGSASFALAKYVREWLIKGLLVLGQPCIVGGPRKALKTTLMVELAIAIGYALRFLERFETPRPRRVLFLSGESGDATIQETARRICRARGIDLEDLEGQVFWGFKLPALSDHAQLAALAEFIRSHGIEVVIVDPLYLCLLSGNSRLDAANLFDVGPLLARITETCLEAGATPLLVHHLRKNRESPHAPPELEDLAFAGVQEFARQWVLIGRRDTYEPGTGEHRLWLNVGGSAGHSGTWAVDVSEGVIDDDFGGRDWRVTIAGASEARVEAKQQQAAAKAEQQAEKDRAKEEARARKLADDAIKALAELKKMPDQQGTKTQWKSRLGWNSERFGPALERLLAEDFARPADVMAPYGRGSKLQPGFRVTLDHLIGKPAEEIPDESRTNPGRVRESPGLDTDDGFPGRDGVSLPEGESPVRPGKKSRSKSAREGKPKERRRETHQRPGLADPDGPAGKGVG